MDTAYTPLSTGLPGLDHVIQSVMPGDNFVWQVDSIEQYTPFVTALADEATRQGRPLVYFRFASHPPLLAAKEGVTVHGIDLSAGFESATTEMHRIIEQAGRGAYFVFDCLSDLTSHWYSDLMLGNFFMLTCPFVYYLDSIAYFALIRNHHTLPVVATIRDTTQLIIDVSTYEDRLYIHPLKVWQRNTPTMYLPHRWEGDTFLPVTDSATISKILTHVKPPAMRSSSRIIDIWDRTFLQAQDVLESYEEENAFREDTKPLFEKLSRMLFTREAARLPLIEKHLSLGDIFKVRERLVGTGLIGGKSLGIVLGRAILRSSDNKWDTLLEVPDSFYIGSDVFYTYIVGNGCWWMRKKQRDAATYLEDVYVACQTMQKGTLPEVITEPFVELLDYFGQAPIIVRSSSLLEDDLGNEFSGVYDSVICVNQGSRSERFEEFVAAVRKVYASAMSKEALTFRAEHGQLNRDEQLALLVQRISGTVTDTLFSPLLTGTGHITADGGSFRLVRGLGTRLGDRSAVAVTFDTTGISITGNLTEQAKVDVLDLHENTIVTTAAPDLPDPGIDIGTLTGKDSPLLADLRDMLSVLNEGFGRLVEVEFTVNAGLDGDYRINLLQCSPAAD